MKRVSLLILAIGAWLPMLSLAQTSDGAGAPRSRPNDDRYNEERYAILSSKIETLIGTQELLLRRYNKIEQQIEALAREIQKVREESARSGASSASREELKTYVEKLADIERKRQEDKELIVKSIRDLAKAPPAPRPEPKPAPERVEAPATTTYKVKESGETLGDIIKAYNAKFKEEGRGSIHLEMVLKENERLNPNVIRIGQTIRIPIPPKK